MRFVIAGALLLVAVVALVAWRRSRSVSTSERLQQAAGRYAQQATEAASQAYERARQAAATAR